MLDPRSEAVLVRDDAEAEFVDLTWKVFQYRLLDRHVELTFGRAGTRPYTYRRDRVAVLSRPTRVSCGSGNLLDADGQLWDEDAEVWRFEGRPEPWLRVFWRDPHGKERFVTVPQARTRIVCGGPTGPRPAQVLAYLRRVAGNLPTKDPTRVAFAGAGRIDHGSALAWYLGGEPVERRTEDVVPLYPFSSNLSQRQAVVRALQHPVSVIEGPPGTGKTQTILNLVASLIATPGTSVGVVSLNNAAVDNVRDKLAEGGLGFVVANLGNQDRCAEFSAGQQDRNSAVTRLVDSAPAEMSLDGLVALERRLDALQAEERRLAGLRAQRDAYLLERAHLTRLLDQGQVPDLADLPLLHRHPDRILDLVAETEPDLPRRTWYPAWADAVRRRVRYGPLGELDTASTDVVLRLYDAYYARRLADLDAQIERTARRLARGSLAQHLADQERLSREALRCALQARYAALPRREHTDKQRVQRFTDFAADYPVVLSSCHSLRRSIGAGNLLDYLVIDEASQVDLLTGYLAMACARRVVVVGDLCQLPHIADAEAAAAAGKAPSEAYDYATQSILSSLIERCGPDPPRTLLREHYRCDPAIIGFCNQKFYDGRLIPFTEPGDSPLVVHRTVEGNHMRQHREGGRSNRREIDVIVGEVLPGLCAEFPRDRIGITAPYRRQVDTAARTLADGPEPLGRAGDVQVDTVHRYQGREKEVMVMTTVLDETWRGRTGLAFVDDPRLVNVAVSRAVRRFVLVTNHGELSASRHLRDLIGYIRYHGGEVVPSRVVSVFDLLYRDYSVRLAGLAGRLRTDSRYRSENIAATVLDDVLAEPKFAGHQVRRQVLVRTVLPDLDRLTPEQRTYVQSRASFDLVVSNAVTKAPVLAVEVDGFAFHEDSPPQRARDALKDAACAAYRLALLRLPTTGCDEEQRIREALRAALAAGSSVRAGR